MLLPCVSMIITKLTVSLTHGMSVHPRQFRDYLLFLCTVEVILFNVWLFTWKVYILYFLGEENCFKVCVEHVVNGDTTLTAFFKLNATDLQANQYLYTAVPNHYSWNKSTIIS